MPAITHSGVDTALYTSNHGYGGHADVTLFTEIHGNMGATITQITAYTDSWQLQGLNVKFSDGNYYKYGKEGNKKSQFTFRTGETIIQLAMYDSHKKCDNGQYHSGGFYFKTNLTREFKVSPKNSPKTKYEVEVGSGLLVGVFGSSDSGKINYLGFAVLRPVESAVLINVSYPGLDTVPVATTPESVDTIKNSNQSSTAQTVELHGSTSVKTENKWSTSTSMEMSSTTTVTTGIPGVESLKESFQWKVGTTASFERSSTKETSTSYDFPVVCSPNMTTTARAIMYEDKISTNYVGTMTYNLDNGKVLSYPVKGIYDGLSARGVNIQIHEVPLDS